MSVVTTLHRHGTGEPLVLIHGVGLDHTMWDLVVPTLAEDRLVVTYDLLGHGTTPDAPGNRSLHDFSIQLISVLDDAAFERADVLGLSIGSLIAISAAAHFPDRIDRLVLANTSFGRTPAQNAAVTKRLEITRTQGMKPIADLALERWFTNEWRAAHPDRVEQVHQALTANDPDAYLKAYSVFVASGAEAEELVGQIHAPTLAITGESDPGSTPAMTMALGELIRDCTTLVLPRRHHLPPIEAPEEFAAAINNFLATT